MAQSAAARQRRDLGLSESGSAASKFRRNPLAPLGDGVLAWAGGAMNEADGGAGIGGTPVGDLDRLLDQTRLLRDRLHRMTVALGISTELVADSLQRLADKGGAMAEHNLLSAKRARASADECRKFGSRLQELGVDDYSPPTSDGVNSLRMVICDDRRLLRESLGKFLANKPRIAGVELVATGDAAVRALRAGADILLLSLGHTGDTDVFEVLEALANRRSRAPVLVLGSAIGVEPAVKALSKGAVGVFRDDVHPAEIYDAVLRVVGGDVVIPEDLVGPVLRRVSVERRQRQADERLLASLTERERAVLQLLSYGVTRSEIADRLGLSENTVRTHVGHVMSKLGVHSQLAAAVKGRRLFPDDAATTRARPETTGGPGAPARRPSQDHPGRADGGARRRCEQDAGKAAADVAGGGRPSVVGGRLDLAARVADTDGCARVPD